MVLDIIKKDSKYLRTRNPEDGKPLDIPRKAVNSITDPDKKKKDD